MSKVVIVGDVMTLSRLLNAGEWSMIQSLELELKVLNWLKLSTEQQASCMLHGVESVSLTDSEVEDVFNMYQQDDVHVVGIEQYGAVLYAIRHEMLFATYDTLTVEMCMRHQMMKYWLSDNKESLLPIYAVHGIYNLKANAV